MTGRPHRFLQSIGAIVAFEGVVKAGSVTAAAHALDVSRSALSRLLKPLEDQFGCALFTREHKRLNPTNATRADHAELSRARDLIQKPEMAMISQGEARSRFACAALERRMCEGHPRGPCQHGQLDRPICEDDKSTARAMANGELLLLP